MNPIVQEFISTNKPLRSIVEAHAKPSDLFLMTFRDIMDHLNQKDLDVEKLDKVDLSIQKGHEDVNLYLLFLCSVMFKLALQQMDTKFYSVQQISSNLINRSTPIDLKVYFHYSSAYGYHFVSNFSERNRHLKEAAAFMNPTSARHKTFLINKSLLLAASGRLEDISTTEKNILLSDSTPVEHLHEILLLNAVNTGNKTDANKYLPLFLESNKNATDLKKNWMRSSVDTLNNKFDYEQYKEVEISNSLKCNYLLKHNKLAEALAFSRGLEYSNKNVFSSKKAITSIRIKCELANKNDLIAERLLEELKDDAENNYFLNFYFARLHLIRNQIENAKSYFNKLLIELKKYQAFGLLESELIVSKDLDTWNIFQLCFNPGAKLEIEERMELRENFISNEIYEEDANFEFLSLSESNKDVPKMIEKYALLKEPILIRGETGTGKELIANQIHKKSKSSQAPLLTINCSTFTETLLQSELFGYTKGSFTGAKGYKKGIFEAAQDGNVFLDEFGEISLNMQASLLRVLENNEIRPIGSSKSKKINCKIIMATNKNLEEMIKTKAFREDLYYRINKLVIKQLPLRDRKEDILPLAIKFAKKYSSNLNFEFDESLKTHLLNHSWPGNIRQMKNLIETMVLHHPNCKIYTLEHFNNPYQFPKTESINEVRGTNYLINSNVNSRPEESEKIKKIMQEGNRTETRRNEIFALFKTYKKVTRLQIIKILNISSLTATTDLKELCNAKLIKKVQPSKSPRSHYFVINETQQ